LPKSSQTETMVLPRARHPDLFGQDSAEQIRRREVSRTLKKLDLSPEEDEAIERLSHSLTVKILLGPISEVMTRAEIQASHKGRGADREASTSE
jgi:glutamyl-tRNA reductase